MGIKNLREQLPLLQALKQAKQPQKRKIILAAGGDPLIKCLGECCHNVLTGNVYMHPAQRQKLKRHAAVIRALGDRKTGLKKKKEILVQRGGFLPALLVPILSAVSGLVGGLFNR